MKVRYTLRARNDLLRILDYITERSPAGGRNVKRAIRTTVELVGRYPHLGKPAGEGDARVLAVGRYPYLVYWSIGTDGIEIVHIRHAARQPP